MAPRWYHRPSPSRPLEAPPRPASWNRTTHPDQIALSAYLDATEKLLGEELEDRERLLALELTVGLPPTTRVDARGRDLDNYLLPLVRRFGAHRFVAVFGRKRLAGTSTVAVSPAQADDSPRTPYVVVRPHGSSQTRDWKASIERQLREIGLAPLPPGPVALDVAITTGPGRNWSTLWKPLIDSLGPVLGQTSAFHPHDDRITDLGLHHRIDVDAGYDVRLALRWAAAGIR